MPRSSSAAATSRRPILGRAMAILTSTLPLTPIAKARAARTLLLFKNTRRARRLRHYSYAYVGEYQFGSPLLLPRPPGLSAWRTTKLRRSRGSRARAVLASLFLCGGCGGGGDLDVAVLDSLPPRPAPHQDHDGGYEQVYGREEEEEEYEIEEEPYDEEEEEEVDRRADRFIERFYQEMRMQETRRLLL